MVFCVLYASYFSPYQAMTTPSLQWPNILKQCLGVDGLYQRCGYGYLGNLTGSDVVGLVTRL
jgi:hypothetical protein